MSRKKKKRSLSRMIYISLLGLNRWIMASFFFYGPRFCLGPRKKNELGQCPSKLTSHLVNNQYILIEQALTIIHIYLDRVTQLEPIDGWEVRISQSSTPGEWVTLAQWGFSIQFGF